MLRLCRSCTARSARNSGSSTNCRDTDKCRSERGSGAGGARSWNAHRFAALAAGVIVREEHTGHADRATRRAGKPLGHVLLSRLKREPSETHVRGHWRCCRVEGRSSLDGRRRKRVPYVVPSQDHVKLFAMDRGKPGNVPALSRKWVFIYIKTRQSKGSGRCRVPALARRRRRARHLRLPGRLRQVVIIIGQIVVVIWRQRGQVGTSAGARWRPWEGGGVSCSSGAKGRAHLPPRPAAVRSATCVRRAERESTQSA